MPGTSANYVVVGAGSAGCVLASRLSEDPEASVVLLEAGGMSRHPNVAIPAAFPKQFKTKLDWDFATEAEPHCDGRSLYLPRGKGLGGSSSMNAMLYVRGRPADYDGWGVPGWSWSDVFPMFLRAENNQRGESEFHATGGPLEVADERSPRELTKKFIAACESRGFRLNPDCNGAYQEGVSLPQVTQRRGRRWSVANAYLRPARSRANLKVITGALVTGVETVDGRAVRVRYRDKRGREHLVAADREVILSAGAFGSPQLLMLSGIGPADHLREHDIAVEVDAPGVGQNLQDHPFVACAWETSGGSLADAESARYLVEWLLRRSGPLTSTLAEAFAFVRSGPDLPDVDLQIHVAPAYFSDHGFDEFDGHAITLGPTLLAPRSRGSVSLRSSEPTDKPSITTNSLCEQSDVDVLVRGIEIAREIAASEPLASTCLRELLPGKSASGADQMAAYIRRHVDLLYHPVGTCRMGLDEAAVVDADLCVRGVEGLRVIDASVMPAITSGNTHAPTVMIAERGADIVRGRSRQAN